MPGNVEHSSFRGSPVSAAQNQKVAAKVHWFDRPAREGDFFFCRDLYMASMAPLLKAIGAWDKDKALAAFSLYYKVGEVCIVMVGDEQAGWMQISQTEREIHLDQIHFLARFRNLGVGTHLMRRTMADAAVKRMPIRLSLVRGNRAIGLYQRLGFQLCGEDKTKFHMKWTPPDGR